MAAKKNSKIQKAPPTDVRNKTPMRVRKSDQLVFSRALGGKTNTAAAINARKRKKR